MTIAYYAESRLVPMLEKNGEYHSETLLLSNREQARFKAFVDVVDSSTYSSAITVSILDKLLESGKISIDQYLKSIPSGYFSDSKIVEEVRDNV